MKNKLIAGLVLAILAPIAANAAPIVWTSQRYNISHTSSIDDPAQANYASDYTATDIIGLPLTDTSSINTVNGSATSTTTIANASNLNANIFSFTNNASSTYTGGTISDQSALAVPTASLRNRFTASSTTLFFGYDYDVSTSISAPTPGLLSFQDFHVELELRDLTAGTRETVNLFDHFLTSQVSNPAFSGFLVNPAGESHTFSDSGSRVFNLVQGNAYELSYSGGAPFVVSRGDITQNFINSQFTISFSDSVTAVPEPETYVMLLTGLALVGFSANRKKQV